MDQLVSMHFGHCLLPKDTHAMLPRLCRLNFWIKLSIISASSVAESSPSGAAELQP